MARPCSWCGADHQPGVIPRAHRIRPYSRLKFQAKKQGEFAKGPADNQLCAIEVHMWCTFGRSLIEVIQRQGDIGHGSGLVSGGNQGTL
jgi:hypothetical protein